MERGSRGSVKNLFVIKQRIASGHYDDDHIIDHVVDSLANELGVGFSATGRLFVGDTGAAPTCHSGCNRQPASGGGK